MNPVMAAIVRGYITTEGLQQPEDGSPIWSHTPLSKYVAMLNEVYSERSAKLFATLREEFNTNEAKDVIEFEEPKGGYFGWVKFLDGTDTAELREFLFKNNYGVNFLPGARCKVGTEILLEHPMAKSAIDDSRFNNYLRVSWAFYEADELVEAARRLKRGWEHYKNQ